jgi:hypothetical protein
MEHDMTALMTKSMLLAGAFVVATAGVARAGVEDVLEVNVPFSFTVGGTTFPAGRYMIERDDMASAVLLIRGERGTPTAAFVTTMSVGHGTEGAVPALTFTRDENHYRLSTIWPSGEDGEQVIGR